MRILTESDIENEINARASILRLMSDHQWHLTIEINQAAQGTEGTRRLRELRQPPFNYTIERNRVIGSRQWQYRLVARQDTP